jgi:hypothetical protein
MRNTYFTLRLLCFLFIALIMPLEIDAQQLCNGSLGDNIFVDGDFGRGQSPTVAIDPMIAPNYRYSTSVPRDGEYSVTQNTGNLAGLYGSWLRVPDNSGTSDGYYMVVNASFSPGIFYEKTIDNLCGNTTYEFSADIINLILPNANPPHSDPNVNFLLDDVVKYGTGDVPKTQKWITYGFTFTTKPGQNSIKLTLRNNAPGGIGNDLGLDNIKFRPCGPVSFVGLSTSNAKFLCVDGKPFTVKANIGNNLKNHFLWQISNDKKTWSNVLKGSIDSVIHKTFVPGKYYYRYYSAGDSTSLENSKCRVLSDEVLVEVLPDIYVKYDTICSGNSYKFGSKLLMNSGYFEETFISSRNCDSTVQLYLNVQADPNIVANTITSDPSCFGLQDGKLLVQDVNGGEPPYAIIYAGKKQQKAIPNLGPGIKKIYISDRFGCTDSFIYDLIEPEKFSLNKFPDTTIVFGDVIDLSVMANQSIDKVTWSPSVLFSCPTCINTQATINSSRQVSLVAVSSTGCKDSVTFQTKVNRDQTFFLSNVLKGNAGGSNEKFVLQSYKSAVKEVVKLNIFDRNGSLVHKMIQMPYLGEPLTLWDGKFSSDIIKEGVFTYALEVKLIDDSTVNLFGDITVIH